MKYKCGHDPKPVIVTCNILSYFAYEEWRTSSGFDGDKSLCWNCWNKK